MLPLRDRLLLAAWVVLVLLLAGLGWQVDRAADRLTAAIDAQTTAMLEARIEAAERRLEAAITRHATEELQARQLLEARIIVLEKSTERLRARLED